MNDSRKTEPAPDEQAPNGNKNPGRHIETTNPVQNENVISNATSEEKDTKPATKSKGNVKPSTATVAKEAFTMSKGHYYVVVGVFNSMNHSMKLTKDMMAKGEMVNVALNPTNNLYYVYLRSTKDKAEALKIRNEYRWKNLFKKAWVFEME
jgi:hypothetical protein